LKATPRKGIVAKRKISVNIDIRESKGPVTVRDIHVGPDFSKDELEKALLEIESQRRENDHWSIISTDLIEKIVFIDESYREMKLKVAEVLSYIQKEIWRDPASRQDGYASRSELSHADVTSILRSHLDRMTARRRNREAALAAFYLAEFYQVFHNSSDADECYAIAVKLAPDNLNYRISAGETALSHGAFEKAEMAFAGAAVLLDGQTDPSTGFKVLNGYGGSLFHQGKYYEAELHYRELLFDISLLKKNDAQAAALLNNLGWILFKLGDVNDGMALLRQSLEMKIRISDSAANRAMTLCNLAHIDMKTDHFDDACFNLDAAEKFVRHEYGKIYPNHPILARVHNQRGVVYLSEKRFDLAAKEFERGILILENQFGRYYTQTLIALHNQFLAYENGSRYRKSKEVAEELRERMRQETVPPEIKKGFEEDYSQIFGRSFVSRVIFRMSATISTYRHRRERARAVQRIH